MLFAGCSQLAPIGEDEVDSLDVAARAAPAIEVPAIAAGDIFGISIQIARR